MFKVIGAAVVCGFALIGLTSIPEDRALRRTNPGLGFKRKSGRVRARIG